MAPPSSSGSTVGEALNILSGYHLSAEPRATALFRRSAKPVGTPPGRPAPESPSGPGSLTPHPVI